MQILSQGIDSGWFIDLFFCNCSPLHRNVQVVLWRSMERGGKVRWVKRGGQVGKRGGQMGNWAIIEWAGEQKGVGSG